MTNEMSIKVGKVIQQSFVLDTHYWKGSNWFSSWFWRYLTMLQESLFDTQRAYLIERELIW